MPSGTKVATKSDESPSIVPLGDEGKVVAGDCGRGAALGATDGGPRATDALAGGCGVCLKLLAGLGWFEYV